MEYIWIKWKMKAFWKGEFDASKKSVKIRLLENLWNFPFPEPENQWFWKDLEYIEYKWSMGDDENGIE